jgi:hypothetical protein
VRLIGLLDERGDPAGAEQILRARADADSPSASLQLAYRLDRRGGRADAERELRRLADAGSRRAVPHLALLLAERSNLTGLRALAEEGGGWAAAEPMAELLARLGRPDEAERLRRFGLAPDGSVASG